MTASSKKLSTYCILIYMPSILVLPVSVLKARKLLCYVHKRINKFVSFVMYVMLFLQRHSMSFATPVTT